MFVSKLLRAAAVAVALLLLAACSESTTDAETFTISVSSGAGTFAPAGLQPAGVPSDSSTGLTGVERVEVAVYDSTNTRARFVSHSDYTYTDDPSGVDHVLLTSTSASQSITLPAGLAPFTFDSFAYDSLSAGNVIAFEGSKSVPTIHNATVSLALVSVLGDAILVPRLPVTAAVPGQVLDLMLYVAANGNTDFDNAYLRVPLTDFTAYYTDLQSVTATDSAWMTNMGIRVMVDDYCVDNITVGGSVWGLIDDQPNPWESSIYISGVSGFQLPCAHSEGNIFVDLIPPQGAITAYDDASGVVQGTASDNTGLGDVRIYDGPVLIATTDLDEVAAPSVTEITFTGANFSVALGVEPEGGLSLVVTDSSGNTFVSEEF